MTKVKILQIDYLCCMARIMAFDYGTKRIGIAVTDPLNIIATSLRTIHPKDIISFLKEYLGKENVSQFVVGEPKQLNNDPSDSAVHVEQFVNLLKKNFPSVPIDREDERFTSKIAGRTLIDSGLKKKDRRDKSLIDAISATIILQSYLERKNI